MHQSTVYERQRVELNETRSTRSDTLQRTSLYGGRAGMLVPGSRWAEDRWPPRPTAPLLAVGPGSRNPPKIAVKSHSVYKIYWDSTQIFIKISTGFLRLAPVVPILTERVHHVWLWTASRLSTLPRPSTSLLDHQPTQSQSPTHGQPTPTPRPSRR